ncbi:MAG TPA: DUF2071 domain-containing protein [Pyrinomonadaceae bacterium]|jgi:hypothetical protein
MLVNFRVDPHVMQRHLPTRFRPKLQKDYAVAGICLIRLEHIRPKLLPPIAGLSSENAAHRVAVLWEDENNRLREGVFIPRRDTNSLMNHLAGGRIFPGEHHRAAFAARQSDSEINLEMKSQDGNVAVRIAGTITDGLPETSIFSSLSEASSFFEKGSLGYSVTGESNRLDGLMLETRQWRVEALDVKEVSSSYFANESMFPKGSVEFDHALIMRDIEHEWHSAPDLYV